jgi:tetratricopeptide (TPR) repeat protein
MGVAYNGLGKYQEAIDAFEKAIKINPDFHEAHRNLENALNLFKAINNNHIVIIMIIRLNLNGFFESVNGFLMLS